MPGWLPAGLDCRFLCDLSSARRVEELEVEVQQRST